MIRNENNKRRIEIYREMHEITIVRTNGFSPTHFCQRCRKDVSTASVEQTAALSNLGLREICRLIGADVIHLVNTEKRIALVCSDSAWAGGRQDKLT